MKTLLIITAITGSLLANEANTAWVDKQVAAIKPPRSGLSTQAISSVADPFIRIKPVPKPGSSAAPKTQAVPAGTKVAKQEPAAAQPLKLDAVLNNSALINDRWYMVNEEVQGYSISKIDQRSVVLIKGKTEKILFISTANPKIKIQTK